jgi:hypothetical protein
MSAVKDVFALLAADDTVTSIVDPSRISPVIRAQDQQLPAVTVARGSLVALYDLSGPAGIAQNTLSVQCWAYTYAEMAALADAVRAVLESAGYILASLQDNFDSSAELSGVYSVTQEFSIWS